MWNDQPVSEAPVEQTPSARKSGRFWPSVGGWLGRLLLALVLATLISAFLARMYMIPSGSMEATLHGCTGCLNDRVLVDKLTYRFRDPHPGEVLVFQMPDSWEESRLEPAPPDNLLARGSHDLAALFGLVPPYRSELVKRVIATGGQTVSCCDARNRLLVDGRPLDEPYLHFPSDGPDGAPEQQAPFGPVKVPAGALWMMGDNRNNSLDSRAPGHGPVPLESVIGKARLITIPLNRLSWIDDHNPQR